MTRDEIICMAREAGASEFRHEKEPDFTLSRIAKIEQFARLVAAAEREACAAICDGKVEAEYATGKVDHNEMGWTQSCAIAIRKRGAL